MYTHQAYVTIEFVSCSLLPIYLVGRVLTVREIQIHLTMSVNRAWHFKLVLLGDSAVGKSCLVVRFVREEFFEFQEPTIGGKILLLLNEFKAVRWVQNSGCGLCYIRCATEVCPFHLISNQFYSFS